MRKINAALNVAWIAAVVAMVVLLVPQPIHADSDPAWYDTGWGYRNTITIDHNRVSNTDQSDFTVLVNSIYPAWKDTANGGHVEQSDGGDILFTSSDGITKLSHEIERYTSATGELIAWVKVPTVSASSDTIIYIYYGNAVCADQWTSDGSTWLSNYRGVWHFKEDPSGGVPQMKDSTSGANNGTCLGGMTAAQRVAAKIDSGLSYDGSNDDVRMANEGNFDFGRTSAFTIEYWAKPTTSNTAIQQSVSKMAEATPWPGYEVSHNNNSGTNTAGYLRVTLVLSQPASNFISVSTASATNLNNGSWHHYVYTYDGSGQASGVKIYEDGVSLAVTQNQDTLSGDPLNNVQLSIGSRNNTNRWYQGILDEVRVSATARTDDWIKTEYNNQNSPVTFYSIGSTQLPAPTLTSPANHTLTNDNTVDLGWSEVAWASQYQVVVDNNAGFSSPEYDSGWGSAWLPGYSYRKMITIHGSEVAAPLSSFPVLVSISSDNDLRTTVNGGHVQNSNGYDIVFSSSDCTTRLNHEIERYAATSGEYVAWVRTDLSSPADTVIYMYYGKIGITTNPSLSSTWGSSYVGVWHLKEDPSGTAPQMKDSTSGANDGTSQGVMTSGDQVSAKIDGGLDYDGTNDNVQMANESNFDFQRTNSFTIEYWAKPASSTSKQQIVSKMPNSSPYTGYEISHNNRSGNYAAGYIRVTLVNRADPAPTYYISVTTTSATKLNDGSWHQYVITYDGTSQASGVKIYEDGVLLAVTLDSNSLDSNTILNNTPLSFGSRAGTIIAFYRGILDEARVSNVARGLAWVATEYNNQNSPTTFFSVGSVQPYVDPTNATTSPLADGTYYWHARAKDPTDNVSDWSSAWDFTIDTTVPGTATVTNPVDGSDYRGATVPASFGGKAADNSGGVGLNANSTTFTLQRGSDSKYWDGISAWQVGVANLATTHSATSGNTEAAWTGSVMMPTWASEGDGTYTVQATATDKVGNSFAGMAVNFNLDNTAPTVTIEQAATQSDPTTRSRIDFTVVFSEPVADFAFGDVLLSGTAGATTATVTGSGTTYNVAVSGMARDGTVIATIAAGVAHDAAGNANTASSSKDNEVTYMRPIGLVPALSVWGAIASALLFCIMIVWLTKRGAIHRRATR